MVILANLRTEDPYFASFVVETQAEPLDQLGQSIGIDLGITNACNFK
jgi:transposase